MNSLEDRAGLMMEAFLDEANTLIKPLLERKLELLNELDRKVGAAEVQLDERRKRVVNNRKRGLSDLDIRGIELLEREIEELYNEKVAVAAQLYDLARRPHETMFEVAGLLKACSPSEEAVPVGRAKPSIGGSQQMNAQTVAMSQPSTSNAMSQLSQRDMAANSMRNVPAQPSELWCYCRKPDDGRTMVACDNPRCGYQWWHADCIQQFVLQFNVGVLPATNGEGATWYCPVCLKANRDNQASQYASMPKHDDDFMARRRARGVR